MANRSTGIVAAIVIIVIVAAGGIYYVSLPKPSTVTTTATSSAAVPSVLTVDEASNPTSLDAGTVIDNNGLEVAQNVNLPLVFCADPGCNRNVPVLATSWIASPDGMTYTFNLRRGVYYSNGDPFNAYVVWYNVYRDLIINQPVDFVFYLYFNATGVTAGDLNALNNAQNTPNNATLLSIMQNPSNSVTVLNSTGIQFHLTNRFVPFMKTINTSPWIFVDPHVVEQNGGVITGQPNSYMAVNGTLVGDGPYVTQTYVPNQYLIMVANPNYWAQNLTSSQSNFVLQPANIQKIVINYKTDELTRTLDVETNKVQASIVAFNDVPSALKNDPNLYIPNLGPSGTLEWLAVNSLKPPLDNPLVRQAIVEAINLTEVQQVAYSGYAESVVGPNLHGYFGYNDSIQPVPYNPTNAQALLAAAGYPGGKGLPPLNLIYPTSAYLTLLAQVVQQNEEQVGITIVPQQVTYSTWIESTYVPGASSQAPYIFASNWTFYPDVSAYWAIVDNSFGVVNNYHNQTIVNWMDQSNTELNPQIRAQEISQITVALRDSYAFVWLSQDLDLYDTGAGFGPTIFNKCVTGMFYNTAFNGVMFNVVTFSCAPS